MVISIGFSHNFSQPLSQADVTCDQSVFQNAIYHSSQHLKM